jgi:cation diffusion facilitator CzcD-associated flavoprotein CzcO
VIETLLIGDECGLTPSFLADFAQQLHARHIQDVTTAVFDDGTDTWRLHTAADETHEARVVIDTRRLHRAPAPTVPGCNDFDGPLFHLAEWPAAFAPAGKRVAVIGNRAAHAVPALDGATVTVFECPPTWRTRRTRSRWMPRLPERAGPRSVASHVARITHSGIETADATHHETDAIVFATECILDESAFAGPAGATAYLGLAVHGFPNYFLVLGPDSPVGDVAAVVEVQRRCITECLNRMRRDGATRIEVRRSVQQQYTERARVTKTARAFDLSATDESLDIYDGPARLSADGDEHSVRVRIAGHLDPIDGKYHWQGTVSGIAPEFGSRPVELAVHEFAVEARITEKTPWGSYSIAGVGAPPFSTQT